MPQILDDLKNKALDVWKRAPTLVVVCGIGLLLLCSTCCLCGGCFTSFVGLGGSESAPQGIALKLDDAWIGNVHIQDRLKFDSYGNMFGRYLTVKARITNETDSKKLDFSCPPRLVTLHDDLGNSYKDIQVDARYRIVGQVSEFSIHPGKSIVAVFVFEPPIKEASWLELAIPGHTCGLSGKLKLRIPTDKIEGFRSGAEKSMSKANSVKDIKEYSLADIQNKIGDSMSLEGGTLEISAPRGWVGSRAGSRYLVGFHEKGSSLSNLPRIFVSVEDSPFPSIKNVDESNVLDFAGQASRYIRQKDFDAWEDQKEAIVPLKLGSTACVQFVDYAKKGNASIARQTLMTVIGGRLYTIHLDVQADQFSRHKEAAYAVTASIESARR